MFSACSACPPRTLRLKALDLLDSKMRAFVIQSSRVSWARHVCCDSHTVF
jgi:hypothetical protein